MRSIRFQWLTLAGGVIFILLFSGFDVLFAHSNPFRKRLSPELEVVEEVSVITEFRSRPKESNPTISDKYLFSQKEYTVEIHTLVLQKSNGQKEELWKHQVEFSKEEKLFLSHPIGVTDVIVQDQVASVIYAVSNLALYAVFIRKTPYATKPWSIMSEDFLKPQSEVEPIVRATFATREKKITVQLQIYSRRACEECYLFEMYELQANNHCQRWKKIRSYKFPFPKDK